MVESKKYSILYMEDDTILTYLFERFCGDDYEVFISCEKEEAINIIENNNIQLIMADYHLPDTTGIEFLKEINEIDGHFGKILISGTDNIDVLKEALNDCAIDQFISKPWTKETLFSSINKALSSYEMKIARSLDYAQLLKKHEELVKKDIEG